MVICDYCGKDMLKSHSCDFPFVKIDGKWYKRVPCNEKECSDCGVKIGKLHHAGCDTERSPVSESSQMLGEEIQVLCDKNKLEFISFYNEFNFTLIIDDINFMSKDLDCKLNILNNNITFCICNMEINDKSYEYYCYVEKDVIKLTLILTYNEHTKILKKDEFLIKDNTDVLATISSIMNFAFKNLEKIYKTEMI